MADVFATATRESHPYSDGPLPINLWFAARGVTIKVIVNDNSPGSSPEQCFAHDWDDTAKPRIDWDDAAARDALISAPISDALAILPVFGEISADDHHFRRPVPRRRSPLTNRPKHR